MVFNLPVPDVMLRSEHVAVVRIFPTLPAASQQLFRRTGAQGDRRVRRSLLHLVWPSLH